MLTIKQSLLFAVGFLIEAAIFWFLLGGFLEGPLLRFFASFADLRLSVDLIKGALLISLLVWGCGFGGHILVAWFDNLNKPDTRSQSGDPGRC